MQGGNVGWVRATVTHRTDCRPWAGNESAALPKARVGYANANPPYIEYIYYALHRQLDFPTRHLQMVGCSAVRLC